MDQFKNNKNINGILIEFDKNCKLNLSTSIKFLS